MKHALSVLAVVLAIAAVSLQGQNGRIAVWAAIILAVVLVLVELINRGEAKGG